jgi:hypothetical protein
MARPRCHYHDRIPRGLVPGPEYTLSTIFRPAPVHPLDSVYLRNVHDRRLLTGTVRVSGRESPLAVHFGARCKTTVGTSTDFSAGALSSSIKVSIKVLVAPIRASLCCFFPVVAFNLCAVAPKLGAVGCEFSQWSVSSKTPVTAFRSGRYVDWIKQLYINSSSSRVVVGVVLWLDK